MKPSVALVLVSLFVSFASAQAPASDNFGKQVDILANRLLASPVAGVSVAVARNGKVVLARGYGVADLQHSVAVTPETVFHIDSVSKNILAAAVLQLVDQGKIGLDDDVTTYIPESPVQGRRLTIRELLSHTSGIFNYTSLPDAENNERLDLTHEQVLALIKDRPFDFDPGAGWRYSNTGFHIAGMVVERVSGQDFGSYVQQHLFEPLGMSSTRMCDARMIIPHLASGYDRDHGSFVNAEVTSWKVPFSAGGICSTATDLVKWQAALDEGRILQPASLKLMRTPIMLSDGTSIDYGLGTRLGNLDGHRMSRHTGSGGGFAATLLDLPDDHVTIAVLIDTGVGAEPPLMLASDVARAVLHLPENQKPLDLPVPQAELTALPGTFDSDEGSVKLFAQNGKLFFRLLPFPTTLPALRRGENDYAVDENTRVHFFEGKDGINWAVVFTRGLMMNVSHQTN